MDAIKINGLVVGLFMAMLIVVLGLAMTPTVTTFVINASAGPTGIGSFVGSTAIIGLTPILWIFCVFLLSLAVIAISIKMLSN